MPTNTKALQVAEPAGFVAGKNKLINGDFNINQRAFTSTTSSATYTFDRYRTECSGGTVTYSAQTFTPGTAPVTGYESTNFLQIVTASQSAAGDYALIEQRIEDVRTFANQTITVSFWAKVGSGTGKVGVAFEQNFGSGGSTAVVIKGGDVTTIGTSWARYSVTVAIPSVSGKTIGTSSYLRLFLFTSAGSNLGGYSNIGATNQTIGLWGIQAEAGSVATPFTTATGTIQGELAACQRYYYRFTGGTVGSSSYAPHATGFAVSTTKSSQLIFLPTTMRTLPNAIDYSTLVLNDGASNTAITALTIANANEGRAFLEATVASGLTQYRPYFILNSNSTTAYLGLSAEL